MKAKIEIDGVTSFCAARAAHLFNTDDSLAIYIHHGYKEAGLFRYKGYTVYALDTLRCVTLGCFERINGRWCCVIRPPELTDVMAQVIIQHLDEWRKVADEGCRGAA